jgi:hypothetical protein
MFCLFRLFHIDLGLGEIKITFEDLTLSICQFIVAHLCLASHPKGCETERQHVEL